MPAKTKRVYGKRKPGVKKTRVPRIRGKGAYTYSNPGPWGRYGRQIGKEAGSKFLAPYVGGKTGSAIGGAAGGLAHYIGRIFGSGDYIASSAVKQNTIIEAQAPSFSSGSGTVRIKHREFLGDVFSSNTASTFKIDSYNINPGLISTFPWLSQVCGSTFQQYRLNGMVFEFRSMSADALNSTNTALGSVIMATDYDSADAAFITKQQMENTEFGVSCKPSSCMIHAIECAPRLTTATELYIRVGVNPPNTDIRLYDWGKFYIATTGFQGTNVNCGELWVSYDVSLIKTIDQVPGFLTPAAYYGLSLASKDTTPVGANGTQILALDTLGITFDSTSTPGVGKIVFPSNIQVGSVFLIQYQLQGAVTSIVTGNNPTAGGGMDIGVAGPNVRTPTGNTSYFLQSIYAKYVNPNPPTLPYVGIPSNTYPATLTAARVMVTQVTGLWPGAVL